MLNKQMQHKSQLKISTNSAIKKLNKNKYVYTSAM